MNLNANKIATALITPNKIASISKARQPITTAENDIGFMSASLQLFGRDGQSGQRGYT